MRNFTGKLGVVILAGLLLVGCQSKEEHLEKETGVKKMEEQVHITKEEEKSIQDVIAAFVRTTNEKILLSIWSYFQRRCLVRKT